VHFFDLYTYWLGDGRVLDACAEMREQTSREDRVACTVRHDGGAVATHYHGFDQISPMDRAEHRLVCEMGDIRVTGWLPAALVVDAAVDDAGVEQLRSCWPQAEVEVVATFGDRPVEIVGRGRTRRVSRRIRLTAASTQGRDELYQDCLRALLADQLAWVHDRSRTRRVDEHNGPAALRLAEAAARRAEQTAARRRPRP
jgi:hypothetical protein